MKPKIKVPKGWYRLRKGTVIKRGDKYWDLGIWFKTLCQGYIVGDIELTGEGIYIRRKPPTHK